MTHIKSLLFLSICLLPLHAADPPHTGPATEKRFPQLKVPEGFKATLFACDPFIEYPSVISLGPRTSSLFVGVDYMTGLGTDGIVKSEVRLIEDTDGDGYADKSTVWAKGFNSIQGLAYHNGIVYVMHAPFLTALRDTKGTGVADERKDLLTGLGLKPEDNPVRLHCANGVVIGHDGWLYLALGDHGCDVMRPEGDRLVLQGGGILRCRKDGADLHIFAKGLRNIYDVALDAELNVFVRDNENDGGTYMNRVYHSFFGADHGYPYLYDDRPDEAMAPLADLGLGSSAGGVCNLETQFPEEYRGNLFFCEWGRSVVRYKPQREGSGFAKLKEIEFATGAENDPYGFKPTDLVVDRDGALFISDWADGQRPKRGRGRIYRITYEPKIKNAPMNSARGLGSDSYFERVTDQRRMESGAKVAPYLPINPRTPEVFERIYRQDRHLVWVRTHKAQSEDIETIFGLASSHEDALVRIQAVRALADLHDPILVRHRLDAGPGDAKVAQRLAVLAMGKDQRILREVVVALGRLRWRDSPDWLAKTLEKPDAALAHAAMMTLRKCDNWPAVLKLLDLPNTEPIRTIAVRAIVEQYVPEVVDGLIERLRSEKDPIRRREYADAITRVYKKPPPWVYWGYRPPPRPANTVAWERTDAIETALNVSLDDSDKAVRLAVLKRMKREKVPAKLDSLVKWLSEETAPETLPVLLEALGDHPAGLIREHLAAVVVEKKKPVNARLSALSQLAGGLDEMSEEGLLAIAKSVEDGLVLAAALRVLGKRPKLKSAPLLLAKVDSLEPSVRAAAIETLAALQVTEAARRVQILLSDPDAGVRQAAATAAGKLNMKAAGASLLKLANERDVGVRRESLESLRLLKDDRVVPLAVTALVDQETQQTALRCIAELGGPEQTKALVDFAKQHPSTDVLAPVIRAFTKWNSNKSVVAELHGASGTLLRWNIAGPLVEDVALIERVASPPKVIIGNPVDPKWETLFGNDIESRTRITFRAGNGTMWLAKTDLSATEKTEVQFLLGSNAALRIWIDGKQVHRRDEAQPYRIDADRFDAMLEEGNHRILIHFPAPRSDIDFHLRFRRKSSTAAHEKLTLAALSRSGNIENGRKLFFNAEKTQCIKCHQIGDKGERIGPELTGIGNRFSRIYLVESILEPSRTIASGFQTFAVTLKDGRTVIGVKVAETDETITFGDKDGKKHLLKKSDIEAQRPEKLSVMPEGLEKSLTVYEFVDLIAFLVSQKDGRPK